MSLQTLTWVSAQNSSGSGPVRLLFLWTLPQATLFWIPVSGFFFLLLYSCFRLPAYSWILPSRVLLVFTKPASILVLIQSTPGLCLCLVHWIYVPGSDSWPYPGLYAPISDSWLAPWFLVSDWWPFPGLCLHHALRTLVPPCPPGSNPAQYDLASVLFSQFCYHFTAQLPAWPCGSPMTMFQPCNDISVLSSCSCPVTT